MKIAEILKSEKVSLSVELFPPKEWSKIDETKAVVREMAKLKPSFMSVTYGASGGTSEHTVSIANEVKNNGICPIAHLTCASSTRDKVEQVINQLKDSGIENILALRGDIPADMDINSCEYHHASELISEIKKAGDFCIGGACYPEGHPEAVSMKKDMDALKIKIDSGCDFLTSQMFFDNNVFYAFRYRMLKRGINVPVVAGIMPVTNAKQTSRICKLSGTSLPPAFKAIVDKFGDNPAAMKQAGIAYATHQIIDLIANGVTNIHIYSMNKPDVAEKIFSNLSEIYHE